MTTSGRPFFAEIAVWTLVYSSWPCPTLFQQIWTSAWAVLKLSTTAAMLGYQPQTDTCGASFFILLVQSVSFGLVPDSSAAGAAPPPPPELLALVAQADSARIRAMPEAPARMDFRMWVPFVLRGLRRRPVPPVASRRSRPNGHRWSISGQGGRSRSVQHARGTISGDRRV